MAMYMGKAEASHAISEALEVLRKYPHQWISYNPNDPLANSVVTYLKKEGKITVNRFFQFQAVAKYKANPSNKKKERLYHLVLTRNTSVKATGYPDTHKHCMTIKSKQSKPNDWMLVEVDYKKNPGPTKGSRMNRLWKLANAADAAFMRAVKKQFPKERAGDARYKSSRFNAATKKAAERMRHATERYLSLLRGK